MQPVATLTSFVMSRLRSEFARLYVSSGPSPADGAAPAPPDLPSPGLLDSAGCTRALVLELAAPADWQRLRAVWQGVQADLGLPAPAIAVTGSDGLQLWFSADAPVPAEAARRWLQALAQRYLPGLPAHRLRLHPEPVPPDSPGPAAPRHAAEVPAVQSDGQRWSAFVASDLVPLFEETPWLDSEPGDDGQAALLERLAVMKPGWMEALLAADGPPPSATPAPGSAASAAPGRSGARGEVGARPAQGGASTGGFAGTGMGAEAAAFLRQVMRDETAPLAVRVEAAKGLLKHAPPGD
jgi:hypothetical protein